MIESSYFRVFLAAVLLYARSCTDASFLSSSSISLLQRIPQVVVHQSKTPSSIRCEPPIKEIDTDNELLISLIGNSDHCDSFFKHDFGTRFVHFSRNDPTTSNLPPPLIGIDMKSLYDSNDYIALRIRGSHDLLDKKEMSYTAFTNYVGDGGSAVVPIIHQADYMHDFKIQIEKIFDQNVSMNVYHSGPKAVALNLHYDAYDVFVLQLQGEKEWTIQADGERKERHTITRWENITMRSGDVLYIPEVSKSERYKSA